MSLQRTLSIIKPDAVKKNIAGKILSLLEINGFKIIALKRIKLSVQDAENFYDIHKERKFFPELVKFMSSGGIIVQVLEGVDAVNNYRKIMGSTNPSEAEEGTIRSKYGESIQNNAVHGSDSIENARKEIKFFFSGLELFD